MRHQYACDECNGEGEVCCPTCGSEIDCEGCNGTGFDDVLFDTQQWQADDAERMKTYSASWEWREGGLYVGRIYGSIRGEVGLKVQFKDYARITPGG